MSEPRKNHLSIDGAQVTEDEHVATYKPIPDSDTEIRTSKSNLSKSKEKVSADGAEEKLLQKEDEAKIVRVDMADAKYVVGDHRNGDAKIELDANKRQFSGLTKEELLKYAEDPFWVRLRWVMFVLFWALWVAMLAGAIAIIVRAPKCSAPTPKQWYEKWPLVEAEISENDYSSLEAELPTLEENRVEAMFVNVPTYDVDKSDVIGKFKAFVDAAKKYSVKVIVDLTPNYVSTSHRWFQLSANRTAPYDDYFVWRSGGLGDDGTPKLPNNWVSTLDEPAWTLNKDRDQYYLHQFGAEQADLNFHNSAVVEEFKSVLGGWMKAGAVGVRLNKARLMLVNSSFLDEVPKSGRDVDPSTVQSQYDYYRQVYTIDQPELDGLFKSFAAVVDANGPTPGSGETVFTLREEGKREPLFLQKGRGAALRPPAAEVRVPLPARSLTRLMHSHWPALQLKGEAAAAGEAADRELALFALLLPAAPVLTMAQLNWGNDTVFKDLVSLRDDAAVQYGNSSVANVPAQNDTASQLLACARYKAGHTGYLAVYNSGTADVRANLTSLPSVPSSVTVHLMSHAVTDATKYKKQETEKADNVLVPPKSTMVLSYIPETAVKS